MEKVILFPFIGTEKSKFSEKELQEIRKNFDEALKEYPGVNLMTFVDSCVVARIVWDSAIKKVIMSKY